MGPCTPSDPILTLKSPRGSRCRFLRPSPSPTPLPPLSMIPLSPSLFLQATKTGQLNTILTFYEISNPPVPSALSGIPESLLRNAISVLAKSGGRAQLISISDGDGVRFFPRAAK
jgi:hypothetical protein